MKKKKRSQKELDKISCGSAETFPTQLNRENYFQCPVWFADAPRFVDDLNTASDRYIEASKKTLKKDILKGGQRRVKCLEPKDPKTTTTSLYKHYFF